MITGMIIENSDETTLEAARIAGIATSVLRQEVNTWPKPGLVSHRDSGSHADMNAEMFHASAEALRPFFAELAQAGFDGGGMDDLRVIGQAAELSMLRATGGVNTHRGAIFALGLLCAAAGAMALVRQPLLTGSLGACVRCRWGASILGGPMSRQSHGAGVLRRYGVGGARAEAAAGFPHVYRVGLPALQIGSLLAAGDANAARVQACFALIAELEDTNLLHRKGEAGLHFAQSAAQSFLKKGGVGQRNWQFHAAKTHRDFVTQWLSPGGSADLLAATLLVHSLEAVPIPSERICRRQPDRHHPKCLVPGFLRADPDGAVK